MPGVCPAKYTGLCWTELQQTGRHPFPWFRYSGRSERHSGKHVRCIASWAHLRVFGLVVYTPCPRVLMIDIRQSLYSARPCWICDPLPKLRDPPSKTNNCPLNREFHLTKYDVISVCYHIRHFYLWLLFCNMFLILFSKWVFGYCRLIVFSKYWIA